MSYAFALSGTLWCASVDQKYIQYLKWYMKLRSFDIYTSTLTWSKFNCIHTHTHTNSSVAFSLPERIHAVQAAQICCGGTVLRKSLRAFKLKHPSFIKLCATHNVCCISYILEVSSAGCNFVSTKHANKARSWWLPTVRQWQCIL